MNLGSFARTLAPTAASALVSMIPGIGPALAPFAGAATGAALGGGGAGPRPPMVGGGAGMNNPAPPFTLGMLPGAMGAPQPPTGLDTTLGLLPLLFGGSRR